MNPVRVAPGAVLPPLHTLRVLPLVLIGKEVAVFALGAFQNDFVSWHGYVLSYQLSAISYQLSVISYQVRAIGLPDSR
jgi:hypothetical protein